MRQIIAPVTRSIAGVFAAFACLAAPGTAHAQEYPNKPVKVIVGFPPGGSNDIVARIVAPKVSEILGQPVVVENKPGANATIGSDYVAKSAPDGYTLLLASASPVVIAPHTFAKIPYDTLKEFQGITTIGVTPEALAVHPSVPAKNIKELVDLSRTKQITISSSGSGGLPHLAIELLKSVTKGNILHVPYKGAAPAITDTIAGHVNGIVMDLPPLYAQIRDGKLRPLAITADARAAVLPDVSTSVEQGFPDFIAVNWVGVFAPARTPRAVVEKLHAAFVKATHDPAVQAQLNKNAVAPSTMASPDAFQKFLQTDYERWGKIAKESGAKAD